jgi:hypothetical protein
MSHEVGVPRIPEPLKEWDQRWFRDFIRVLEGWMQAMTSESEEEAGAVAVQEITSDTDAGPNDGLFLVDTTAGEVTVTLPDPGDVLGREFTIKKITGGPNCALVRATNGSVERTGVYCLLKQYAAITVKSDGVEYWIVAQVVGGDTRIIPSAGGLVFGSSATIAPTTGGLTLTGVAPTVNV